MFKNNGKLKLLIIVGTRPEIIRLSAVINKCRKYFDVVLAHTGQNYDYNLNGVFFKDLELEDPERYIREKFKDKELKYEKTVQEDGTIIFDIDTSGIRQRYSFTEI